MSKAPPPEAATLEVVDAATQPVMTVEFEDGNPSRLRPFALDHAVIQEPELAESIILTTVLAFHVLSVKLGPG